MVNITVEVPPVKVPPFVKLPLIVVVELPALKVPPLVRVLTTIVKVPAVNVPELLRVPLIVGPLFKITLLLLLIVRLFNAVTLLGILTPLELPPKTRLDDEVVARFAGVPAIVGPLSVSVLAPTVNVPLVKVRVPLIVGLPFKLTPLLLLIVKLYNAVTLLGMLIPVELPPKTRLDDEVVASLDGVPAIVGPLSVSVLAPTENVPLVKVRVPLIVGLLFNVTPLLLLIVRLFNPDTLLGMTTEDELPPKTRLDDEEVDRLAGVPAIVGPLSVSVLEPTVNVPLVKVNVPLMVIPLLRLRPALLISVRLLKVFVPLPLIVWRLLPLKVTKPLPGVKVPPLLVQLPFRIALSPGVKLPVAVLVKLPLMLIEPVVV